MSMDCCKRCGTYIDTDFDLECYRSKADPRKLWTDHINDDGVCICEDCCARGGLDEDEHYDEREDLEKWVSA